LISGIINTPAIVTIRFGVSTFPYSSILAGMTDAESTGVDSFNDFEPITQRVPSSMKGFI
tara:strand:+ start:156 stop:335 length:180 start_codon:yes stop_codon:yes gene_type:complete